jgi:hypothetical protein
VLTRARPQLADSQLRFTTQLCGGDHLAAVAARRLGLANLRCPAASGSLAPRQLTTQTAAVLGTAGIGLGPTPERNTVGRFPLRRTCESDPEPTSLALISSRKLATPSSAKSSCACSTCQAERWTDSTVRSASTSGRAPRRDLDLDCDPRRSCRGSKRHRLEAEERRFVVRRRHHMCSVWVRKHDAVVNNQRCSALAMVGREMVALAPCRDASLLRWALASLGATAARSAAATSGTPPSPEGP